MVAEFWWHFWKAARTSISVANSHSAKVETLEPGISSSSWLVESAWGMDLMLLQSMQNLVPESPLVQKVCFMANPSWIQPPIVKWSLMSCLESVACGKHTPSLGFATGFWRKSGKCQPECWRFPGFWRWKPQTMHLHAGACYGILRMIHRLPWFFFPACGSTGCLGTPHQSTAATSMGLPAVRPCCCGFHGAALPTDLLAGKVQPRETWCWPSRWLQAGHQWCPLAHATIMAHMHSCWTISCEWPLSCPWHA